MSPSGPEFALQMAAATRDERPRRPEAKPELEVGRASWPSRNWRPILRGVQVRNHDEAEAQTRSQRASRMTKQANGTNKSTSSDLQAPNRGTHRTLCTGSALVLVIFVPFVLVTTCAAAFGGQTLPPMDTAELIGLDQLDQHEMLAAGELPLASQADDWPSQQQQQQHLVAAAPFDRQQQVDWGQRLTPNPPDGAQPWPVQQQQSPLARAIEATRSFMRQQHQQLANATLMQQPAAPLGPTPMAEPISQRLRHEEALLRQPAPPAAGSPLQVANKLYNFLFQPKAGPSLSSSLAQSLVEVRRKMSQPAPTGGATASQEPFQYASSEDNFRHSSGAREQRSLVTLSAPYEQQAASSNESRVEPQFQWQAESSRGVVEEASDKQLAGEQQAESEQVEPANEDETGQQQNGTMQWQLGGQEEVEIERHQPETQRQHQVEQAPEDEQQVMMVAGGEMYEQVVNEAQPPDSNRLPGNETAHFFVAANETSLEAEQQLQGQAPDEPPETNSTEGADASLQGDESLLAVQLPSQYDSVIGVPPEGHYDDYFKPLVSSGASPMPSDQPPAGRGSAAPNATSFSEQHSVGSSQAELAEQFSVGQLVAGGQNGAAPPFQSAPTLLTNSSSKFSASSSYYPAADLASSSSTAGQLEGSNQSLVSLTGQRSSGGGQYQVVSGLGRQHNSSEDGIQLIVANSRDELHDPGTNEKVITYTSENGQDSLARLIGKPARNTFFNKDLNEIPAAPKPSNAPILLHHVATTSRRPTRSPPPPPAAVAPKLVVSGVATPTSQLEHVYEMVLEPGEAPLEAVEQQFGQYASGPSSRADYESRLAAARANAAPSRVSGPNQRQPPDKQSRHSDKKAASYSNHNIQIRNNNNNNNHQQTPRPQVTQAKFSLKELPLNAPTESPTLAESTTRAIENLPSRAKRLREADKNELMNELLAALDRVKAAIYKLQPLTAKMNAIYRKSVTSNTRDQILDNHKGTYAKRYPPGDYDDAYDRMHPSELAASRQRASSGRTTSRRSSGPINGTAQAGGDRWQQAEGMLARDSQTSPVYLPAPREVLQMNRARGGPPPSAGGANWTSSLEGRFKGSRSMAQLSRRSGELAATATDSSRAWRLAVDGGGASQESPMFGYRITIYQSPSDGAESSESYEPGPEEREKQILSYSLIDDGHGQPIEFSSVLENERQLPVPSIDSMATSESSLVPQVEGGDEEEEEEEDDTPSRMEASESGKAEAISEKRRKKQSEGAEEGAMKKAKKAQGKKGGEKHSKQQHKGKKGHEEHKRQKVFKKIKHHKGVTSRESHKLHRDKHIKAHDRGAAKEKALKERTQIEFFEREQIVDDEFEKGKKSTMKAGWASGHDSKKSSSEIGAGHHGGDAMSMGGSQQVGRVSVEPPQTAASASSLAPMMVLEAAASDEHGEKQASKGKGHSVASSSGRQSNKFEKKHMEARGKKFKGWREKGYKIITETEFIDRGSLHDSAYKKRDKGAAHHQKFKKHEANSEGHEGKMKEMHKKSHKKEEKSHKSAEKKHELGGKVEEGAKRGAKKGAKKEKEEKKTEKHTSGGDHDQEESALSARSEPLLARAQMNPRSGNFSHQLPVQLIAKVLNQMGTKAAANKTDERRDQTRERPTVARLATDVAATNGNKPTKETLVGAQASKSTSEGPAKLETARNSATTVGSNATLPDIIGRLNATRPADKKPAGRPPTLSLVRLVNTLAELNRTQSGAVAAAVGKARDRSERPAGSGGQQPRERVQADRVQFDEQPVAQHSWPSHRDQEQGERHYRGSLSASIAHEGRKLQDFGRQSLGAMQMIAEPSERPFFARAAAPQQHHQNQNQPRNLDQNRWPLVAPGVSLPLGLKGQQLYQTEPRHVQQFFYDTPQDGALTLASASAEPSLVADYDSLIGLGPAGFQQQQQPEVGQPFQRQQPQAFGFLAD